MSETNLIKAVRDHSLENYNSGGWDFVVECWEDSDIAECITGAKDAVDAIRMVGETVAVMSEFRESVRSEIF